MHVAEAGSGEPVVLLHGFPQHWWEWRKVLPALAARYRVICPDLRGAGCTDAPRVGYARDHLLRDVIALLDVSMCWDWTRCASWGTTGEVCSAFGSACPTRSGSSGTYASPPPTHTLGFPPAPRGDVALAGEYRGTRLHTPTLLLYGAVLYGGGDDSTGPPRILSGYEDHADDLTLAHVPGSGYYLADEQPDVLVEKALDFFALPSAGSAGANR